MHRVHTCVFFAHDTVMRQKSRSLERSIIMEKRKNPSISCSVAQCTHNLCTENFCTLDQVRIDTHESDPSVKECVDCASFVKRQNFC